MINDTIYITVDHIEEFKPFFNFRIGELLKIGKDTDNTYDDEAIAVYQELGVKCGYVANSVDTVARGTYSAGRIYDKFDTEAYCIVRFATDELLICELKITEETVDRPAL